MTGEPPDKVVPIDGHAARRRWVEESLGAAGFVATEYFLERKLRERTYIADPTLGLDVALRRTRMMIMSLPEAQIARRRRHRGRNEIRVEAGATMWIVVLEQDLTIVVNVFIWDHQ